MLHVQQDVKRIENFKSVLFIILKRGNVKRVL